MKIKLADIYRALLKKGFCDEDTISNLCKEIEELEIDDKHILRD